MKKKYKQVMFILITGFVLNVFYNLTDSINAISINEADPYLSSYLDEKLISPEGHPVVFLISKNKKHPIPNIDVFNSYEYKWNDVVEISQKVEHAYELAELVKTTDDEKIYFLKSGKIFWIRTPEIFISAGYNSVENDVVVINKYELNYYLDNYKDLRLLKGVDQTVFLISPFGTKRAIRNQEIFESYGYSWGDIRTSSRLLNALPETILVRAVNDYKVYKIENGEKHWIVNQDAFMSNGFDFTQIEEISKLDLELYPKGNVIK